MAHQYVKSLERFTYVPEQLYLTIDGDNSRKYTVEEILASGIKDNNWISRTVAYSIECSERLMPICFCYTLADTYLHVAVPRFVPNSLFRFTKHKTAGA
jgi:hypothetical protein